MKTINYLFLAASVILSAACSKENATVDNGPVAARIDAGIDDMKTRVSGTSWTQGDIILVSVTSTGKTTGSDVKYRKTADGWEAVDAPIYFQDRNDATFRAYYPELDPAAIVDGTYSFVWDTNANQDFMFASGAVASKNNPQVSFTGDHIFKHCMSQLTFTFKAGAGVESIGEGNIIMLYGLTSKGTFDTTTGVVSEVISDEQIAISKLLDAPAGAKSHTLDPIICIPQENHGIEMTIRLNVSYYSVILELPAETDHKLRPGDNLHYTVTINKTGIEIGTAEIMPWNEVNINVEATM